MPELTPEQIAVLNAQAWMAIAMTIVIFIMHFYCLYLDSKE